MAIDFRGSPTGKCPKCKQPVKMKVDETKNCSNKLCGVLLECVVSGFNPSIKFREVTTPAAKK